MTETTAMHQYQDSESMISQGNPESAGPSVLETPGYSDQAEASGLSHLLPHYDIIILGTGIVESMVAGALAKSSHASSHGRPPLSILHIDSNPWYGGCLGVMNLAQLLEWMVRRKVRKGEPTSPSSFVDPLFDDPSSLQSNSDQNNRFQLCQLTIGSWCREFDSTGKSFSTRETRTHQESFDDHSINSDREAIRLFIQKHPLYAELIYQLFPREILSWPGCDVKAAFALCQLLDKNRDYNLELCPTFVYANGALVQLLIRTEVGKYVEFRAPGDIFTAYASSSDMQALPGSKEDIFSNDAIGLKDKRNLMKTISHIIKIDSDDIVDGMVQPGSPESFIEYLKSMGLCDTLVSMMVSATFITGKAEARQLSFRDGANIVAKYLKSAGVFAKSGFLVGIFGAGSEIAQSFCRTCAVYGGTYLLDTNVSINYIPKMDLNPSIILDDSGKRISCTHLICAQEFLPAVEHQMSPTSETSGPNGITSLNIIRPITRGIFIVDAPILSETLGLLVIPPEINSDCFAESGIIISQQSSDNFCCPDPYFIIYAISRGDSVGLVNSTIRQLCERSGSRIRMSFIYKQLCHSSTAPTSSSVHVVQNLFNSSDMDFDNAVAIATEIAHKIMPECPFFSQ